MRMKYTDEIKLLVVKVRKVSKNRPGIKVKKIAGREPIASLRTRKGCSRLNVLDTLLVGNMGGKKQENTL